MYMRTRTARRGVIAAALFIGATLALSLLVHRVANAGTAARRTRTISFVPPSRWGLGYSRYSLKMCGSKGAARVIDLGYSVKCGPLEFDVRDRADDPSE